jgi:hypothetical protein
MTYTINGKEYTKMAINVRCAQIMGYNATFIKNLTLFLRDYDPCNNPADTDAIIDKCFDDLLSDVDYNGLDHIHNDPAYSSKWEYLIRNHNCTKLVAACICLIEVNE